MNVDTGERLAAGPIPPPPAKEATPTTPKPPDPVTEGYKEVLLELNDLISMAKVRMKAINQPKKRSLQARDIATFLKQKTMVLQRLATHERLKLPRSAPAKAKAKPETKAKEEPKLKPIPMIRPNGAPMIGSALGGLAGTISARKEETN